MINVFNKSFLTNLTAVLIIVAGYLFPIEPDLIKPIGFFALSGAITNWLAIHMLFEKVPFLYGSGTSNVAFGAHEQIKKVEDSIRMESLSCFMAENIISS